MLSASATVDPAILRGMMNAMAAMNRDFGRAAKVAPKSIAIDVCRSLRAKTKKAPKRARPSEYRITRDASNPKWITYDKRKTPHKLRFALHRWRLTRKLGTPDQYSADHYAYARANRNRSGRIISDYAAEKREIKRLHLGIPRAGLAKLSWSWIITKIRGGSVPPTRRKGRGRDPTLATDGSYRKVGKGAVAAIHNALDYIGDAVLPLSIDQAMRDAITKRAFLTAASQGLSPAEAAEYARGLALEFERTN